MSHSKIITDLHKYGYLPGIPLEAAMLFDLSDSVILDAVDRFRDFMGVTSAMDDESLFSIPRCGCPDFMEQDKVGSGGNWPRCHGIGNFHAANIRVLNAPPAHLARNGNFAEVQRRVTRANQEIGLQLYWSGPGSPIQDNKTGHQLTVQFVQTSSGWIGLAEVRSNQSCSSVMWSRYLARYLNTGSDEQVRRMWSILFLHELGHNMGTGHTRGGIMNPSILSLEPTWRNDPLAPWLRTRYGGEPIPNVPPPLIDPPDSDYGIYPPGWPRN